MEMSISLKCSVCGNDLFSVVDETVEVLLDAPNDTLVKCSDCGREKQKKNLLKKTVISLRLMLKILKQTS